MNCKQGKTFLRWSKVYIRKASGMVAGYRNRSIADSRHNGPSLRRRRRSLPSSRKRRRRRPRRKPSVSKRPRKRKRSARQGRLNGKRNARRGQRSARLSARRRPPSGSARSRKTPWPASPRASWDPPAVPPTTRLSADSSARAASCWRREHRAGHSPEHQAVHHDVWSGLLVRGQLVPPRRLWRGPICWPAVFQSRFQLFGGR